MGVTVTRFPVLLMICLGVVLSAMGQPAVPRSTPPEVSQSYILGPDDQIVIQALEVPEILDRPYRIPPDGYLQLPLAGRLLASGTTADGLSVLISENLKSFMRQPQVTVSITEYRSQPVSVLGAVKSPGIIQLQGRKTLIEVLSMAGGMADDAGCCVRITRRKEWGELNLPGSAPDSTGQFIVGDARLKSVLGAQKPEENILIRPFDVISVPRAELIYVIGQVRKPGGFVLRERERLSVLQALSLAEGLDRGAAPDRARILRPGGDLGTRREIPLNLSRILKGQAEDVALGPDDVLFIPGSAAKSAALRTAEAAIQIGTGIAIWGRP